MFILVLQNTDLSIVQRITCNTESDADNGIHGEHSINVFHFKCTAPDEGKRIYSWESQHMCCASCAASKHQFLNRNSCIACVLYIQYQWERSQEFGFQVKNDQEQ